MPEAGVTLELASERASLLDRLSYELSFVIPADRSMPIGGHARIRFVLRDTVRPLVLDFAPGAGSLGSVRIGGVLTGCRASDGHLLIPASKLAAGDNTIEIAFRAGDAAVTRHSEFLYTLFVPGRAHLMFPCFDQPDLKARFTLEIEAPVGWQVVSNAAEISRDVSDHRVRMRYAETPPIPTYLLAIAAGQFDVEIAERAGRTYRMFHRETDRQKIARNRDAVFDLHASALAWLEEYTATPYQFGKFDFVLLPSFQFSGMEHPGSIFYNAESILLDRSATEPKILGRASLIAHEIAHMWFGNLVTMRWFDDVWLKEVFANFLAAKIVGRRFPEVNHELRFLLAHYPPAYSVDRTAGTHPIRQPLDNLNDAGSLYGPIVYHKAPIVMRQLEQLIGGKALQEGVRAYLESYAFGNASWPDLVNMLDERGDLGLENWSRAWVEEAGRPSIHTELLVGPHGLVQRLTFLQADRDSDRGLRWSQPLEIVVGGSNGTRAIQLELSDEFVDVPSLTSLPKPDFILPAGRGFAYGRFLLDGASREFLLGHLADLADPTARASAWITLWEEMLDGLVRPSVFLDAALPALEREDTEQVVQLLSGYVREVFWRFIPIEARLPIAPRLEEILLAGLAHAPASSLKATYFSAFLASVTTPEGLRFLERVWRRQEKISGLTLAEPDEASMAIELAFRAVPEASIILEEQRARFLNPDRRARFEFVTPALSDREETRDACFESLRDVTNRRHEFWVIEALQCLNHPLRAATAQKHLRTALDLLVEVRRTGDIFFPSHWLRATLGGHATPGAADIVRTFLSERPDLPIQLRRLIVQAADVLFRAAEISASPEPPKRMS